MKYVFAIGRQFFYQYLNDVDFGDIHNNKSHIIFYSVMKVMLEQWYLKHKASAGSYFNVIGAGGWCERTGARAGRDVAGCSPASKRSRRYVMLHY